ncbi:MAG: transposase, partial [Christensenellaceae bacterium]|nr:transposase [Christensenellaceae bacterium]
MTSSRVVEKLSSKESLRKKLNGQDPYEWDNNYIDTLNQLKKDESEKVTIVLSPNTAVSNDQRQFSGGYLFLQKLYHELGLNLNCNKISKKYSFKFDLDNIFSRLLYSRIIYPSSKLTTFKLSTKFLEPRNFELHDVYRALDVIANETDYIQANIYKNSLKCSKRNTNILYYDCTNFFFEIDNESGLKQYGISKEHRPNPIVQMGLFIDGYGLPLAFSINPGNTNEKTSLKPLEKRILNDFKLSKFIVCTDAGLASTANRMFNNYGDRAFVTTQSIKQLKDHLMIWALDTKRWRICGSDRFYDISAIDEDEYKKSIFYKERWINENGLEQRLIVTFSVKTKIYQRHIRQEQIERAEKLIKIKPKNFKTNQNDHKRFVVMTKSTKSGEIAEVIDYSLNTELITKEEKFDGFYAVCTNLDGKVQEIIEINRRRWEIEESFRIMKSEFKSRPVYLSRDNRIHAHFTTCFVALIIYRMLE